MKRGGDAVIYICVFFSLVQDFACECSELAFHVHSKQCEMVAAPSMAPFRKGIYRLAALSLFTLALVVLSLFYHPIRTTEQAGIRNRALFGRPQTALRAKPSQGENTRDRNNRLDLGEEECRAAFPLAFAEIDSAVARGSFVFEKSNPDYKGLVQARIRDGKVRTF